MVSGETNIILRHSNFLDQASLSADLIKVEGSISGIHTGEFLLSDDNKTMVFNPDRAFTGNEVVTVALSYGLKKLSGSKIPGYSFSFNTAPAGLVQLPNDAFFETASSTDDQDPGILKRTAADAFLPPPPITIDSIDNPSEGYIFMATWDRNMPALYGNFIFILDK
ncbi:MAG: hypothetical protein KAI29_18160, partial [Cyclobacteriaceae bacterium]|nr:hypothetical protein [Cyclobacteriaceae bacterium]